MRRSWIFWVLVAAFIWLLVTRYTELQGLIQTLLQGEWHWVFIAAVLQVLFYIALTASFRSAFETVEVETRLFDLLPITLGALFVNVLAPSGGAAGAALFVDNAKQRGQSPARAAAGTLLQLVANYAAFSLVLILGLFYLFTAHDLNVVEIAGAAILLASILGMSLVLLEGFWHPALLQRIFVWLQASLNWFSEKIHSQHFLDDHWAERHASEFSSASTAIAGHPWLLARTLSIALVAHLVNLTSLYTIFIAFHNPVRLDTLVAGYAMAMLFWIVSPTPQGVGIVEGAMALVLTSLSVPGYTATTVSLAFRGLTFWLPMFLGFLLLRRTKSFSKIKPN